MRQLEVVSVSDDGTHVLLAADGDATRASHAVRIDDRLIAAIRGELDTSDRRPSALTPREIQARLRAGETSESVAKAARIPLARVLRYAGPVESERDRIVEQAQAVPMARNRGGLTSRPMGEAVERHLTTLSGYKPETVAWTARRRDDGTWLIEVAYYARGAKRATWLWQPATGELTAANVLAGRLAADEPATRPRRKSAATARRAASNGGRKASQGSGKSRQRTGRVAAEAPVETPAPAPTPAGARSWSDVLLGAQVMDEPLTVRRIREPAAAKPVPARKADRASKKAAAAKKSTGRKNSGR